MSLHLIGGSGTFANTDEAKLSFVKSSVFYKRGLSFLDSCLSKGCHIPSISFIASSMSILS